MIKTAEGTEPFLTQREQAPDIVGDEQLTGDAWDYRVGKGHFDPRLGAPQSVMPTVGRAMWRRCGHHF